MTKRLKWTFVSTIAALFLAVLFAFTAGAGLMRASAAEGDEAPAAGWYVVGSGAGSLKECSWTDYKADFKLEGTADDEVNYLGYWETPEMLLYAGDQFKFLYANGEWLWPSQSGWGEDIQAQFSNIVDNTDTDFVDGGLGNIQARASGYYTFVLDVYEDGEAIVMDVTFVRSDEEAPDITLLDMYVVGNIASVPSCNWPSEVKDVATSCIKMTYNAATNKWTATVNLIPSDQFKVFNAISGTYFPSGMNNNATGYAEGTYVIEWETDAPDFLVILASEYPTK